MRPAHYQFVVDANGGHWKVPTCVPCKVSDEPADFPTDFTHNRAREVIRDVLNGSIGKGGRRELRKALDTKDAPPTREQARDEALNRALRLNR